MRRRRRTRGERCPYRKSSLGNGITEKNNFSFNDAKGNYLYYRYEDGGGIVYDKDLQIYRGNYRGSSEIFKDKITEEERIMAIRLKNAPRHIVCTPKVLLGDLAIYDDRGEDLFDLADEINELTRTERTDLWMKIVDRVMWLQKYFGVANVDIKRENVLLDRDTGEPVLIDLQSFVDIDRGIGVLWSDWCAATPSNYSPYRRRHFRSLLAFEVYLLSTLYLNIRFPLMGDVEELFDKGKLENLLTVTDNSLLKACRKNFNKYDSVEHFMSEILRIISKNHHHHHHRDDHR